MSEAGGTAGGTAGGASAQVARVSFEVAATLLALAGIRSGDYVLDVGCGTGGLTFPAAAAAGLGGRAVGFDADLSVLDAARLRHPERSGPSLVWVCGDRTRLPFPDGVFDKLVSARTEHDFAEYARVLKPGGRLAVVTTAGLAPEARPGTAADEPPGTTAESLVAVFAAAGLRLLPEAPGDGVIRYVGAMRT